MENTVVMYIGFRKNHNDTTYGTGIWNDADTKSVPADIAKKLLKHSDVWMAVDVAPKNIEVVEVSKQKENSEEEESLKVRDAITAMESKQAIADFISANYAGMKVDKRGSLDAMKQNAIRIVDQFGVTA